MSQSSRWKLQGGMNRRPNNNIITNNTSHSNILNTRTFGTANTTIDKVADLRDIQEASIYNFDQNAINFNNVICYYPFNDLSYNPNTPLPALTTNTDISNQSLATNLPQPQPFPLLFKDPSNNGTFYKPYVVYNDSISQNVVKLDPSSQVLTTDLSFNTLNAFGNTTISTISTALTFSCFVYINKSDVSTSPGQSKQFCLFALDDLSQNALQYLSQGPPTSDSSSNLLYLWYPNTNGKAQLLYNYKNDSPEDSNSYINKQSTKQIPTDKWTQVVLVMAGLSIYLMIDGEIYIQSANSEVRVASFIPEQPININLGPYTVTPDESAPPTITDTNTTNTAKPLLSDCKIANWAVGQQLAAAVASPGGYGHQYNINSVPNKEGLLYYLLSKEVCSFSAPTVFRGALNVGGNLQSYGTNNFYGNNTFFTNTHFADGITVDGSFNQIIYDETGNVFINSSTTATSKKNASLLINNQANPVNTTPGFDTMASMLVFTSATPIDTQSKPSLPLYVNELQFSISGENVSVGHGFGDSSFNVFGDSTLSGVLDANGGINTTIINSNIINVFDKLDVSGTGINFTNGYIGISQDTTTGPIRIGNAAGATSQGDYSVAIGNNMGQTGQGTESVAIGNNAGQTGQGNNSVAIGNNAGFTTQGNGTIAIGRKAGFTTQGTNSVAIGNNAGDNSQSSNSVAIGNNAGNTNQGANSVAIGPNTLCQNNSSVALGSGATTTADNQIVLGTLNETVNIPGNVGIGTSTPGTTLDITNDVSGAIIQRWDCDGRVMDLINPATADGETPFIFSTGNAYQFKTDNRVSLDINAKGNVAIQKAVSNNSRSLDVSGNANFTGVVSAATPAFSATGTELATASWVLDHSQTGGGGWTTVSGSPDTLTSTANTKVVISGSGSGSLDVSGVLSFTSGYIGISQDNETEGPIRIGYEAGNTAQSGNGVAIGNQAGYSGQGSSGVAIGNYAGHTSQGQYSVAMGAAAGQSNQGLKSIAIGSSAGTNNQGTNSIAIGREAGDFSLGTNSVAIGPNTVCQYNYSVALGSGATTTADNQIRLGTATQNVSIPGVCEALSFVATSDARHKENICDLDRALEKICSIRGVNFNFKDDDENNKHAGILAQEVHEIIPEAIYKKDDDKWAANYNTFIGYLIESVKTLKKENDEYKKGKDEQNIKIETLESNMEEQGQLIQQLMDKMN